METKFGVMKLFNHTLNRLIAYVKQRIYPSFRLKWAFCSNFWINATLLETFVFW